ncbi:MAG: response regulator, partial [bacterium]
MLSHEILVVDDEQNVLDLLEETFVTAGYRVVTALDAHSALKILDSTTPDIILSDNRMPHMSGVEFFEILRHQHPDPIRILMTGYADLGIAIEAINRGWVYRFITKPFHMEEILVTLQRAVEYYEIVRQKQLLEQQIREQNAVLELRVKERTRELQELTRELEEKNRKLLYQKNKIDRLFSNLQHSYLGTISALYFAMEAKDRYTRGHSER